MVNRKGFSLTEVLVALSILAAVIVPFVNNLSLSRLQSVKSEKKLLAMFLADNLFEHLELFYNNKENKFKAQRIVFANVSEMMKQMAIDFQDPLISESIDTTYSTFIPLYTTEPDPDLPEKIMKIHVEIYWSEASGNRKIDYYGVIVR